MPKSGLNWHTNTLVPNMARFVFKANVAIAAAAKEVARQAQEYMQANAPWEDRTGDARAGLKAEAVHHGFRQEIYLYHTVDYGIWLEVRWDGQYAIILPTLEHFSGRNLWPFFDGIMGASVGRSLL